MVKLLLVLLIIGSLFIFVIGVKRVVKKKRIESMSIIISSICILLSSSVIFSIFS